MKTRKYLSLLLTVVLLLGMFPVQALADAKKDEDKKEDKVQEVVLVFQDTAVGYKEAPKAQRAVLKNDTDKAIEYQAAEEKTATKDAKTGGFTFTDKVKADPGKEAAFTVTPKEGLAVGIYESKFVVKADDKIVKTVIAKWRVTDSQLPTVQESPKQDEPESQKPSADGSTPQDPSAVENVLTEVILDLGLQEFPNGISWEDVTKALPTDTKIRTSAGGEQQAPIVWETEEGIYDPDKTEVQILTLKGTVQLPEGVTNPNNLTLQVQVTVQINEKPAAPTEENILLAIEMPKDITDIPNGTEKTVEALGLPKTVDIQTSKGEPDAAEVVWNLEDCPYDPKETASQTYTIDGKVQLPEGVINSDDLSLDIQIVIQVLEASEPIETPTPPVTPEYSIKADVKDLDFGEKTEGYKEAPQAQSILLENTGNGKLHLKKILAEDFKINCTQMVIQPEETTVVTVQPEKGLSTGLYQETLWIETEEGADTTVGVTFKVKEKEEKPENYIADPSNNQIKGITYDGTYKAGTKFTFKAVGAGMDHDKPIKGDVRYRPDEWEAYNYKGSWDQPPYEGSFTIQSGGTYTLQVYFEKEVYDGEQWIAQGKWESKVVRFKVNKKAASITKTPTTKATVKPTAKPADNNSKTKTPVRTGDNSPIAALAVLAAAMGVIIVATIWKKNKR